MKKYKIYLNKVQKAKLKWILITVIQTFPYRTEIRKDAYELLRILRNDKRTEK